MISDERRSEITFDNIAQSDCGITALQAVCGLPRREAEELLTREGEYTPNVGTPRGGVEAAALAAGFAVEPVAFDPSDTAATFSLRNEYGRFLVYTEGHVMALVEGELYNARGSGRMPVTGASRVR